MSGNPWTPGPWAWWDSPFRPAVYDLAKLLSPEKQILRLYGGAGMHALGRNQEAEANARLIEAAPEMAEKLEQAAAKFEFYEQQHRAKGTADADAKAEVNRKMAADIRALLARIRGDAK